MRIPHPFLSSLADNQVTPLYGYLMFLNTPLLGIAR